MARGPWDNQKAVKNYCKNFDTQVYSWEHSEIFTLTWLSGCLRKMQGIWGVRVRWIFITKISISQVHELPGLRCSHF